MRVVRGLARAIAAVVEGFSTLMGVGRGSARRAMFDRWFDAERRPWFPGDGRRRDGPRDGDASGWAP